ncbi:MAG: hypothetical protein ACYC61_25580 [Isosphaeraceae bacterium]
MKPAVATPCLWAAILVLRAGIAFTLCPADPRLPVHLFRIRGFPAGRLVLAHDRFAVLRSLRNGQAVPPGPRPA